MSEPISEKHFASFCKGLGYFVEKIPCSNQRTADFRVITPTISIIAEVKELNGGDKAVAVLQKFAEERSISLSSVPGKLATNHIKNASGQISASGKDLPALVVLYSNISREGLPAIMPDEHVSPDDIDAAMYGPLTMFVKLGQHSTGGNCYNAPPNGQPLASAHRHIAAVAVLSSYTQKHLAVYHNLFAKTPLPPASFAGPGIQHYFKIPCEGHQLAGWQRLERQE